METITQAAELEQALAEHPAVLLLFGGAACGVCQALKPQLERMLAREFPALRALYLDCQGGAGALCAQQGVFSLPVVQLWFDRRKFAEFARVFGIGQVRAAIARPYALLVGKDGTP